jgi:hypothetical protein
MLLVEELSALQAVVELSDHPVEQVPLSPGMTQALGLGVDSPLAAGSLERGPQLGEVETGGSGRGRSGGQDGAGLRSGQAVLLAEEGVQGGRVVLAQQRADLVDRLLAVPDRVLLDAGENGDGAGRSESEGSGRWACMSVGSPGCRRSLVRPPGAGNHKGFTRHPRATTHSSISQTSHPNPARLDPYTRIRNNRCTHTIGRRRPHPAVG